MTIKDKAFIAGIYEHPLRDIPDKSLAEVTAELAAGALADAGLSISDVDGFLFGGDGNIRVMSMADYLGLKELSYVDSTETGGSSYLLHVGHAAMAIAAGKCKVALITLAGLPRQRRGGGMGRSDETPDNGFEPLYGLTIPSMYALVAKRHMYDWGTTSRQLAEIKVAASTHAQYNPNAFLKNVVTIDEVLESPMISDPLHRLDCCVITDGGGALVVVAPEIARELPRHCVRVLGHGETLKFPVAGRIDLSFNGALISGPRAFEESGLTHADIDYASIYDSFTITVLQTLEDLGFCERGKGGEFVSDGGLLSPGGKLPFNTDGGGLCNNHPGNRGGMTKVIEAVRQLRGEAHPAVQVPDCTHALAHGTGGSLGTRHGSSTLILGREDA